MSDINQVPNLPYEPSRESRQASKPDAQKFKEMMKIGDSEKKQKKGKKRQTESEEELKARLRSGAASAEKDVEGAKKGAKVPKIQQVGESEKREPKREKRAEEVSPEAIEEEGLSTVQREKTSQVKIESELTDLENKMAILSQSVPQELEAEEKEEEAQAVYEEKQEGAEESVTNQTQKVESVEKEEAATQAVLPASTTLGPLFIAPPSEAPPAYATLNSEVLALFERMVGVISIMKESGITETIIHLNTAEFSNSRFAGSQIIIREFSTAPLAYNIELQGTPQNTALFEQNVGSLMQAFQSSNYPFRINRIDTRLLSQRPDKPLFHRKETSSEKNLSQ